MVWTRRSEPPTPSGCRVDGRSRPRSPERYALVAHGVQDRPGGSSFDGQPSQAGRVGAMHRGPPVGALAHVSRHPSLGAMPTSVATNPWSPSPCTLGGRRNTDERTPIPLSESVSSVVARGAGRVGPDLITRHQPVVLGGNLPELSPSMPDASTKGRSESANAVPMASTARRSAAPAAAKLPPKATSC